MAVNYQYFGILGHGDTPDNPAGVIRTWTDEGGRVLEETFRGSLTWEPSMRLSPLARPDEDYYVEIDESVAERVVERITKNVIAGRYRSSS